MNRITKALGCGALLVIGLLMAHESRAACNYPISPTSRGHGYGATNNSVVVNADPGCTWTVTSNDGWISIQPGWGGVGSNVVNYTVAANTVTVGRTGTVTIASQTFTVRQDPAPCNYSVSPSAITHGYGGASSSFDVTATAGCSWTAINTSVWINLIANTSGTGGVTSVSYFVPANTTPVWRTGFVAVVNKTYELRQRPAPCIYELSPTNTTRGYSGATGNVNVTITSGNNCSWIVQNTNAWITINTTSGLGNSNFTYIVASNSSSIARTGTVTVWDQTFLVAQGGAPCNPSISSSSFNTSADEATRTINLALAGGCPWTVTNNYNWITVSPMNGNGSSPIDIQVAANANTAGRTGVVSIAGQSYTVRQDGAVCTYTLSPQSRQHGTSATNNSVNVSTLSVCSWTVFNTNAWLTFAATNGVGDSNINYSIAANNGALDRIGHVQIGDHYFVVTQKAVGCSIGLSPVTRPHGYSQTNNFVTINVGAGCVWTAGTSNSWIILAANSGTGPTQLNYTVAANPNGVARVGYINVEDATLTLTQAGAPCTNAIFPEAVTNSPLEDIVSVAVYGPPGCVLNITNPNPWITIISGNGGTAGNTNVIFEVATNITGATRVGVVQIGDQDFTIVQRGVNCNYKLSPAQRGHGPAPVTNTLIMNVSNPCPWSVINTNPWISILTNASGVGSNEITYAIAANTVPFERVGYLQVDGQFCVITQRAANCTYSISPSSRAHGFNASANSFTITTLNGCPWNAYSSNTWISIAYGVSGTNTDEIGYVLEANTNFLDRIGYIFADSQTFVVTQRAATCAITLSPTTRNHGFSAATNTFSLTTGGGCSWSISNGAPWITILTNASGTGPATVTYTVSSNATASTRIAALQLDNQAFTITQAAYTCSYKLSPTNRPHGFGQSTNSIGIIAGSTCSWVVSNTNEWINITSGLSGTGNSNFTYTVYPNYGNTSRTGMVFLADEVVTFVQSASTNGLAIESLILGESGDVTLKLNGGPPGIWQVLGSTNLNDWKQIGNATNITGKVDFHIVPADATNRFYKAFLP